MISRRQAIAGTIGTLAILGGACVAEEINPRALSLLQSHYYNKYVKSINWHYSESNITITTIELQPKAITEKHTPTWDYVWNITQQDKSLQSLSKKEFDENILYLYRTYLNRDNISNIEITCGDGRILFIITDDTYLGKMSLMFSMITEEFKQKIEYQLQTLGYRQ